MKKILIFFILAALGVAAYAQELDTLTVRSAKETAKPVQAGAGFHSTHRTPAWPQKVMQPSKAGEKGWETGRIYSVPSLVAQMVR